MALAGVVKTKKYKLSYKAVPYQVTPSRDFLAALISLGTVSDLSAAALQHGAAKRVVLVVVELTTYSSGRPPACVQGQYYGTV